MNTKPRTYYIGLPKTFIAGTLIDQKNGDCLGDAEISVKESTSNATFTAKSDYLGEFLVDGLDAKKTYEVTITKAGTTP